MNSKTFQNKFELLAPAGDFEKMEYAFAYGADAVYLGIPDFSLRVRINSFTLDQVREAIECAHTMKKKIYVTANIYAHNEHIKQLPTYLKKLNQWKPDALIVSDPGVIQLVKKYAPRIPIHLSTQANATNWQAVSFWYKQGVSRVILGREVMLAEIKEIHKRVPKCELEYFVHGAMCMSYSGRCMLSSWLTGRSANLGDCAQPCRWKYSVSATQPLPYPPLIKGTESRFLEMEVEEPKRPGMKIPVEEDKHGTYIFNSKDLCLIEYIPELIDAGITSFKIEGRAKSVAYLGSVIKAYRQAIDEGKDKKKLTLLKKKYLNTLVHRGYTTGFLFGRDIVEQNIENSHVGGEEEFVGEVLSSTKEGKKWNMVFKPHNALQVGDSVRIIQPDKKDLLIVIKELYTTHGISVKSAHGGSGQTVIIPVNSEVPQYSILFKKYIPKSN